VNRREEDARLAVREAELTLADAEAAEGAGSPASADAREALELARANYARVQEEAAAEFAEIKRKIEALNRENANGLIAPALDRTLAGHPDCELVVVHNRPLFELLHARFPRQVRYHESLPYADYLRLLESCHVGLLPLAGAPAERFKTDLKFQEFASRGVACIASPTVYAASIHDAIDGFIARSPDDWTDRLTRLVEDESLRARMAARGWETLQDRLQSSLVGDRVNRYRELWRRRDELTASLLERHPELR